MRKVAIFRSELLPLSETFIYQQARALVNWQPILFGFTRVEKNGLETPEVETVIVPKERNTLLETLRFWLALPMPSVVKTLKSIGVDLVHAHFGTDATEIWPSVRAAKMPMVVTLHGYDINIHRSWWKSGKGGRRRRVYPQRLLQMARHPNVSFIAVSKAIKARAVQCGIPEEKVKVAYIGVDIERFKPAGMPIDQRKKQILFVGRMVPKKAPLLLLEAYAEVLKLVPDAELVMIGDGPLRESAELKAKQLHVIVGFLGAQNSDSVLARLHEARILCLPSITTENGDAEGLPIVNVEAQACGVPVVTTKHSGNPEAINEGVSGISVPENDVGRLTNALVRLLTDQKLIVAASKASILNATQNFNLALGAEGLARIYEDFDK